MQNTPLAPPRRVVADIWGVATDVRWALTSCWGFQGEYFTGQTLGRYNAAILQDVNTDTFEGVRATGGRDEVYCYLHPELHTHVGYGIDDPLDVDLAPQQQVRNETYFANLIWDVTRQFRTELEFTFRKTAYTAVPSNEGFGVYTQFQWRF